MINKAYDKTLNFIDKNLKNEKEKYMDGMKNNYFQWEDLKNDFESMLNKNNQIDPVREQLMNDNSRLKRILENHGIRY